MYCKKCGCELPDGSKFCYNCGEKIKDDDLIKKREQVFEGTIHKCPNCGTVINSFEGKCSNCGYEFRGGLSTASLKEFSLKLTKAQTEEEKELLIRSFPIPNTKEDVMDFMLLASSNIQTEDTTDIYNAWAIKLEQGYQKAKIIMNDDEDFQVIDELYNKTKKKIDSKKTLKTAGKAINKTGSILSTIINFFIENALTIIGAILCIVAVSVDMKHDNSSLIELSAVTLLIISAGTLAKRKVNFVAYVICVLSAGFLFVEASKLRNGSMFQIAGFIIIIVVGVNIVKRNRIDKQKKN